ncbi:MAG TPA: hypothetical protein VLI04_23270 [Nocardioidaceae bacterium]|nr:hypothetical protein [Nocardioidaceae bacterium]
MPKLAVGLLAMIAAQVAFIPPASAAPVSVTPTVVAVRDTSAWSPTSPDPSGIVYLPGSDRFLIGDGEVEEMPLYAGVNLYTSTRQGALVGTGTTLPWSNEPTGVAFDPATGRGFFTDDDKKTLFVIAGAGADGQFGTADDGPRTSFKVPPFGHIDAEDAAFDTLRGELLFVDGLFMKMFRLNKGPDGVFNGVAPEGDDIATEFELAQLGAIDPEGIAYDGARDTVLVVDGDTDTIYELDPNGSLITTMNILGAGIIKAAGIAIAPASDGSGKRNYYVVDRGLDNNSHPEENDGRILELSVTLPSINNRPPAVYAGPDQMLDRNQTAVLRGTATDDGKPKPLSYQWSKVSGPGNVSFSSAKAVATNATFSLAGSYVLRFQGDDTKLSDIDDLVVNVFEPGAARTVQIPVASSSDDALEGGGANGNFVDTGSADVELGHNGIGAPPPQMLAGLRFVNVPAPQGSTILSASIQFQVDEAGSEPASYTIRGEARDHASTYVSSAGSISSRTSTGATVAWAPPAWTLIGEAGPNQQTPDLKAIVQEIVNRPGWLNGNAMAFMIDGTGRRTAEAKDGLGGARLVLTYLRGANRAPYVNAGPDRAIELPTSTLSLDGTVVDDGQPNTVATAAWTKVAGPGTVTFSAATSPDTNATFSAAGTYVLRLTSSDGALATSDEVTVVVYATGASPTTATFALAAASDDAMEGGGATGKFVDLGSLDIELGNNGATTPVTMLTGLRFAGVGVPQGSVILGARIQFQVDEVGTNAATFAIRGEASANAASYAAVAGNISARPTTAASVGWSPPAWTSLGGRGPDQQTSDVKTIVQEIVSQRGWIAGNAMAFMIDGTGRRTAEAFESGAALAATLVLEYRRGANTAPVVNAGPDQVIQPSSAATLDGSVGDDGQPSATPTTTWSKVAGPGTVTFGNAAAVDTTATFSTWGTYTLRLTAHDGALSDFDEISVQVDRGESGPTVNAGPDQGISLPANAALDGTVIDSGHTTTGNPLDPVTTAWSMLSGPGTVTFADSTAADTTATFSTNGTYVLRLTATNALGLPGSDDVIVTVSPPPRSPAVSAGPDRNVKIKAGANLDGTLTDAGLPAATLQWSKVSGPGTVTFQNPTSIDTKASFSAVGTYTLRLTASNGFFTVYDDVVVVVRP